MSDEIDVMKLFAKNDFDLFWRLAFQELEPGQELLNNWHLRYLAQVLMAVERGEIKRLIINVPPRSLKSLLASVAFPAFLLGRDPRRRIICVSYAERLARKFSIDTRTVMQSAWYRALYPNTVLTSRRPPQLEFSTTTHGKRYAAGFGGSITGQGADFIICDDPMKAMDALSEKARQSNHEFFDGTLSTRLNNKKTGAIIIIMQRLHEDDLVGHLIKQGGWTVVRLPAVAVEDETFRLSDWPNDFYHRKAGELLHPDREGPEELDRARRSMGSWYFSAQYQQEPVPRGGNVIKREWLRYYDELPEGERLSIASWDTASTIGQTSDWSVGIVWIKIGTDFYLLHLERGRYEMPELKRQIIEMHEYFELDVTVIEDTELGRALEQNIRQDRKIKVQLSKPKFDKEARLSVQSVKFENGQVFLPRGEEWLEAYVNELIAFPGGKHDDQVDATSQALHWLSERGTKTPQMLNVKVRTLKTPSRRGPDPYDIFRSR